MLISLVVRLGGGPGSASPLRRDRLTRAFRSGLVACIFILLAVPSCRESPTEDVRNEGDDEPPEHPIEVNVVTVVDGLEHPWGIAFLPGDGPDFLVTERPGRLRVVRGGELDPDPVGGLPEIRAGGQGGLLDVALHPDFEANRLVYLSYSTDAGDGRTNLSVARGRFDGDGLTEVEVFHTESMGIAGRHYGSRLVFDAGGYLYVTVGDRGQDGNAQDLTNHIGTTLRLHDDGGVPDDNPFVGEEGVLPEIFTYGNRNAQGMALHPETGEIWQSEHGPQGGDELNVIEAGGDYGWPEYNFGEHYDGQPISDPGPESGTVLPVAHWTPALAPAGITFYAGDRFPAWRGNLFMATLRGQHLRRLELDGDEVVDEEELLGDLGVRFREVAEGSDGYLYLLTDEPVGQVLRLEPTGDP